MYLDFDPIGGGRVNAFLLGTNSTTGFGNYQAQAPVDTLSGKLGSTIPISVRFPSGGALVASNGSLKLGFKPTGQYNAGAWDAYTDVLVPAGTTGDASLTYTGLLALTADALFALFPVASNGSAPDSVTIMGALLDGNVELSTFSFNVTNNLFKGTETPPTAVDAVLPFPSSTALATTAALSALVPYAYRDPGAETSGLIDAMLAGRVPGAANALFVTADTTNGTFATRNPLLFCARLDWSGFSFSNSTEGAYQGGEAITSRHVLLADHFSDPVNGTPPMSIGTVLAFVDNANVVSKRSITAFDRIGTTDLLIATLDSDLPPGITPATVLPGGLAPDLFPPGTAVLYGNQAKTIHVAEIQDFASATIRSAVAANRAPWTTAGPAIGGDSGSPVSLVIQGQRVLWFEFHYASGGGDLPGAQVAAINAVVQQAGPQYSLTVASFPALGEAAFRATTGGTGAVGAVDPTTGQFPPNIIPPLGTAPVNVEQVWDGTADVTLALGTTLFRGNFTAISTQRIVTIADGSQANRTVELLMPRYTANSFQIGINYNYAGNPTTLVTLNPSPLTAVAYTRYFLEFGSDGLWRVSSPLEGGEMVNVSGRRSYVGVTSASSVVVDFKSGALQAIPLGSDLTITSANLSTGATVRLRLIGDQTATRNLSFPTGWTFVGSAVPTSLAAGKTAILELTSWSRFDTGVTATYLVQS